MEIVENWTFTIHSLIEFPLKNLLIKTNEKYYFLCKFAKRSIFDRWANKHKKKLIRQI